MQTSQPSAPSERTSLRAKGKRSRTSWVAAAVVGAWMLIVRIGGSSAAERKG
jgi:hypothetical protein